MPSHSVTLGCFPATSKCPPVLCLVRTELLAPRTDEEHFLALSSVQHTNYVDSRYCSVEWPRKAASCSGREGLRRFVYRPPRQEPYTKINRHPPFLISILWYESTGISISLAPPWRPLSSNWMPEGTCPESTFYVQLHRKPGRGHCAKGEAREWSVFQPGWRSI